MRRRTLLKGAGGIGPMLLVGRTETQGIEIRIVEATEPVQAGDFLEITADVTNTTTTDHRPAVEFYVGDDLLVTRLTTIPAGESTTMEFSHLTYPVREEVAVSTSIRTGTTTAERTVDVSGVSELQDDQLRPARELSIPPETAVLFEVEWDALGEFGGRTRWYVDEQFSGWSQGPWNAAYYQAQGRDHLTQSFTTDGSYDVAASIRGDEENRTARWTVAVTGDATAAPTIESTSPDPGPLEVSSTETVDLEATVSAPATLDRAVWWLAHADVVLGVDDLSGTEATTSFSTDRFCHGCPVVLWVIDERGAVTEEPLWTPRISFDGESRLSIVDTNAPVEAGGDLEVSIDVRNTTDTQRIEDLELVVGDEVVDARSLTLDPNTTQTVTLGYETYPVRTDVSVPVLVRSDADRDSTTVDVFADVGPAELTILDATDPVLAGERLEVDAEVTNTHDATITDTIHLVAGDRVDSASVTLDPDESRVLTLGYETYPVTVDVEFPIEVAGTGSHDRRSVRVYAEALPSVRVAITETNAPVGAGEFLEVTAAIENAGKSSVTEDVSLGIGGEQVDRESVTLARGESTAVDLGYETYPVKQAVEFPVTVESDGVSDQQVVTVSPEGGGGDDQDEDEESEADGQQAGPGALELVDYHIRVDDDTQNEYIRLRNATGDPLDLSRWRIEDDSRVSGENLNPYRFPRGFTVDRGATVTLVTGNGANTDDTLYWGIGNPIWDQDGDVVRVFDASGDVILEASIAADADGEAQDGDGEDNAEAGPVTVAIDGTNAPVEGGDRLNVQATLTDDGTADATRTAELVVGGEVVDSRSVTVPGEGSRSVDLGYSTYPVQQDVSFEVVVRTDDDSAATTVAVVGTDDASSDEDSNSVAEEESGDGTATQSDDRESANPPEANDSEQEEQVGEDEPPGATEEPESEDEQPAGEEPIEEDESASDDSPDAESADVSPESEAPSDETGTDNSSTAGS